MFVCGHYLPYFSDQIGLGQFHVLGNTFQTDWNLLSRGEAGSLQA